MNRRRHFGTELVSWRPGKLAFNSARALVWQTLRTVCLTLNILVLTRVFTPSAFGTLAAILSLATLLGAANGGGASLLVLRDAVQSPGQITTIVKCALGSIVLFSPCCTLLMYGLLVLVLPVQADTAVWLPLAVAEIVLTPYSAITASAFQSRERLGMAGLIQTIPVIGKLAAAASLMLWSPTPSPPTYALLYLIFTAGGAVLIAVLNATSPKMPQIRFGSIWQWWRRSLGFSAMYLTASATIDFDKSLVLRNSNADNAGHYVLGHRITMALSMPIGALSQAMLPRLINQLQEARGMAKGTVVAALAVTFVYSLGAAACLVLLGHWLSAVFGPAYANLVPLLPGFGLLLGIYNMRLLSAAVLYAENKPWSRSALESVAVLLVCVLSAVLVPRYGLWGALMTALASELWICLASWTLAARALMRN